jgi:hypothetical protein
MADDAWTFGTPVRVEIDKDDWHDGIFDAVSRFTGHTGVMHLGVILTGGDGYVIAPAARVRRR